MSEQIKAIETNYAGYRFRSRTEARWAVFFDALAIKWEYEKEGYVINGVPYLPDFWLPELKFWFEVKGERAPQEEVDLLVSLAKQTKHAAVIWQGTPANHYGMIWVSEFEQPTFRDVTNRVCSWTEWNDEGVGLITFGDEEDCWQKFGCLNPNEPLAFVGSSGTNREFSYDRICEAINRAKSARFEHGEKP